MVVYSTNIEKYIRMRGYKLKEVFEQLEMNPSSYYRMKENNQFTTKVLEQFANFLEVEIEDLVRSNTQEKIRNMQNDFNIIEEKLDKFKKDYLT